MRRFAKRAAILGAVLLVLAIVAAAAQYWRMRQVREALYDAFTPVTITNCEFERFGDSNDGGYLLCANLLDQVQAAYSYGIDGRDEWGCDVVARLTVPLHQYDCFNTEAPRCATPADVQFHVACVGPERAMIDGRPFDTMANHLEQNAHAGTRLVVKMDVEGSEWRSLATAPDHVLGAIDQLVVEFHDVEDPRFLETITRLKEFFHVAHVHINNYECRPGLDPFPSPVFEALLVNVRIAVTDPSVDARGPSPLDAPNNPRTADCQSATAQSELQRIGGWIFRYWQGLLIRAGLD